MSHPENIKTYIFGVTDRLSGVCTACGIPRPIFIGLTEGGDTVACCCFCSRVLARHQEEA